MAWGEGVFQQLGIFFNPSSLPVPVTVCAVMVPGNSFTSH